MSSTSSYGQKCTYLHGMRHPSLHVLGHGQDARHHHHAQLPYYLGSFITRREKTVDGHDTNLRSSRLSLQGFQNEIWEEKLKNLAAWSILYGFGAWYMRSLTGGYIGLRVW